MKHITTTHKGKLVLAYRADGALFCTDCGAPKGAGFVEVITDDTIDELYDVDTAGDGQTLKTVWSSCTSCGESLRSEAAPW